ncbi:MAG: hypothetical protein WD314_05095 [Trueperaceae bacterium]
MTGILGNSGSMNPDGLLDLALRLSCSGTLVLHYRAGSRLLLLDSGRIKTSFDLGQPDAASRTGVDFHFEPHHANDLPQIASSFAGSAVGVLRAVPVLGPAQPLPPGIVDLRALVTNMRLERASGALTVQVDQETGPGQQAASDQKTGFGRETGIALFHEGKIGAAYFEKSSHVWERSDALRAIFRYSLESGRAPMLLHRLEPDLVRSLLGLALERRMGSGDPSSFTGISAGEGGYTFYCQGQAYLHVTAGLLGASGRFGQLEAVPDLELPDDPPGWERRRFDLTLRGRDALNPMTELSMEFSSNYGQSGKRVLESVRHGLSIEDTAARLELDLQALKPWLERLEADGLIRLRG